QFGMISELDQDVELCRKALLVHQTTRRHPDVCLNDLGIALWRRFQQQGNFTDLAEVIKIHREALALCKQDHPRRARTLNNLGLALCQRFQHQGDSKDLEEALELYREALILYKPPNPNHGMSPQNLVIKLWRRFQQKPWREPTTLYELAGLERSMLLNNLANAVLTRFEQQGDTRDIDEAAKLHREALALRKPPHCNRGMSLGSLGLTMWRRFQQQGDSKDLIEAIALHREALTLQEPNDATYSMCLNNLANAVLTRFRQQGDTRDVDEAIQLQREALELREPSHPDRSMSLISLAAAVLERFTQRGDIADVNEAIELHAEVAKLCEPTHPNCGMSLNNLGMALWHRFQHQGAFEDLDEAIKLFRAALELWEPPHPDRSLSLNNLATAVRIRFWQQGDARDIDEAIKLSREALTLCEPPHPHRIMSLDNLATAVRTRFKQQGELGDINEAIELHRETLTLLEPPHPECAMALNNLATALRERFGQQGDTEDINEAVDLHRRALAVCDPSHPQHGVLANHLVDGLVTRFEQQKDTRDITEAIKLCRQALILYKPPQRDHRMSAHTLATALWTNFEEQGNLDDLNEAIELYREGLTLCESPHPERGKVLNNLATAVLARFTQKGDTKDLNEGIKLRGEALTLFSPSHPDRGASLKNLACAVAMRFKCHRDPTDLHKAVELLWEALTLQKPPHPDCSDTLESLAICLVFQYEWCHDRDYLETASNLFQEAVNCSTSSPTRFQHAWSWARNMAEHWPTSSLTAYCAAIELLPRLAALHLDLSSRQQMFSTITKPNLASDAATCAVALGQYKTAVELLEAGRSIFWSQALHLRTSFDDLAAIHPGLSTKLTNLATQLEQASFRDTSRDIMMTQKEIRSIESESAHCRQLNEGWEKTIKEVQSMPGFEDFMQPKAIAMLQQAAVSGPIIILTTSHSTSFALIVTLSSDVQYLELPKLTLLEAQVLADMSRQCEHRSELQVRIFAGREGSINTNAEEVFRGLLADLWKNIVKPVFDVLNLEARIIFSSVNHPRLWWCPTGPFVFLPIHAAGLYTGDTTDCVSDYVISSYTPTLSALLHPPVQTTTSFKMTAVIEPKAPGCSPLPGARAELKEIIARVPDQWLTGLVSSTMESAVIHLRESSIVHFACHGIQDLYLPLDSGLLLSDGRLKVSEIMRRLGGENSSELKKSMSLAFLSACETGKGDKNVPDEAMHLAATLLFAGFRGVVATMWTMNDLDGPKIADAFYEHLFIDCDPNSNPPVLPDLTQAAKALHVAVTKLRQEPGIPFRRWVPFVHYG
ncbi:CHAT domain-containing protein, partial [Mycena leptocephala]